MDGCCSSPAFQGYYTNTVISQRVWIPAKSKVEQKVQHQVFPADTSLWQLSPVCFALFIFSSRFSWVDWIWSIVNLSDGSRSAFMSPNSCAFHLLWFYSACAHNVCHQPKERERLHPTVLLGSALRGVHCFWQLQWQGSQNAGTATVLGPEYHHSAFLVFLLFKPGKYKYTHTHTMTHEYQLRVDLCGSHYHIHTAENLLWCTDQCKNKYKVLQFSLQVILFSFSDRLLFSPVSPLPRWCPQVKLFFKTRKPEAKPGGGAAAHLAWIFQQCPISATP